MDARGRLGCERQPYPQADYLRAAAAVARSVGAQALLEQGFQGAELGEALKRERLNALKAFREEARARAAQ
ncbi:Multifunctional CCA protein [compost metagenome]